MPYKTVFTYNGLCFFPAPKIYLTISQPVLFGAVSEMKCSWHGNLCDDKIVKWYRRSNGITEIMWLSNNSRNSPEPGFESKLMLQASTYPEAQCHFHKINLLNISKDDEEEYFCSVTLDHNFTYSSKETALRIFGKYHWSILQILHEGFALF